MKFEVTRTSMWSNERPCPEARLEPSLKQDRRTCTEEEFDRRNLGNGKKWRDQGFNHRKAERGSGFKIVRDFQGERWVVEIESLDDLMKFYRKYGSLVIESSQSSQQNEEFTCIEIYDDYRE